MVEDVASTVKQEKKAEVVTCDPPQILDAVEEDLGSTLQRHLQPQSAFPTDVKAAPSSVTTELDTLHTISDLVSTSAGESGSLPGDVCLTCSRSDFCADHH